MEPNTQPQPTEPTPVEPAAPGAAAAQLEPAHATPAHTPHTPQTPASNGEPETPKKDGWRSWMSTIAVIVVAMSLAFILPAFVFQSYQVSGPSMETTLQNNDRLIVWKAPKTWARITGQTYMPHRSDVVIFVKHNLYENGVTQDKQLVKRVIGLPGDRVVVNNGVVTIYNADHPKGYNPDATYPYGSVITSTPGNLDITVPEGEIFVSGDNRANSLDSRSFGTIPVSDVVGKLVLRMYPISQVKVF